jgi:hypothetical protein
VQALGSSPLPREAATSLREIEPAWPDAARLEPVADPSGPLETACFSIAFDQRGAVTRLLDKTSGREWASADHPLGLLRYETFSQADYMRFYRQYIANRRRNKRWAVPDFTKPGLAPAMAAHRDWLPQRSRLFRQQEDRGHRFLLLLRMPAEPSTRYGCPRDLTVEIWCQDDQPCLYFNLQWFNKQACRLPEAIWFTFAPQARKSGCWMLDKMGRWISPLEVILGGNRKLHAVGTGVAYHEAHASLSLETLDAPLVAPGDRSLLNFNNRQPPLRRGMHFLLYNNLWGTNFPMWYEEDARFRFILRFGS